MSEKRWMQMYQQGWELIHVPSRDMFVEWNLSFSSGYILSYIPPVPDTVNFSD